LRITDDAYERGLNARGTYRERVAEVTDGLDLVLAPTLPYVAPRLPVDDLAVRESAIRRTLPINALGWPALALPCGAAEDGLPASIQLIGKPGADALVLGDLGCMLNIEGRLRRRGNTTTKVLHVAEVLASEKP
jgi:Asp-tRNA(Asn)/Glu-tRNA(Gln) amidotransferase A subunit family amidase